MPRTSFALAAISGLALASLLAAGCGSSAQGGATAASLAPAPGTSSGAGPAGLVSPLRCHARAVIRRPRVRTIARIAVHTAARARVTGTTSSGLVPPAPVGRAGARGWRTLRFGLRRARAGQPIVVTVSVSRHGRTGTCRASFRPRAVPRPWPAPTPVTTLAPPLNSSPPAPAGCHPLSDEGTCYEPGEFCRDSDHGVTGVAGDGKTITCEDNDGWRWEPA